MIHWKTFEIYLSYTEKGVSNMSVNILQNVSENILKKSFIWSDVSLRFCMH